MPVMQMTGRSSEYAPAMALIMLRPPTVNVATQAPTPRALRAGSCTDQQRMAGAAFGAAMRESMEGGKHAEREGLTLHTHPPHTQR